MAEQARNRNADAVGGIFLDLEAFGRLKGSRDRKQVAAAWLETLGKQNEGMRQGLVLLSSVGQGQFEPAAVWPRGAKPERTLLAGVETAVRSGRAIIQTLPEGNEREGVALAVPITIGGHLRGAVGVVIGPTDQAGIQLMLDQMQWGSAWIETLLQRARVEDSSGLVTVVELLATSLHHKRFQEAAIATATELATALDCERVAIAFMRGRHARVRALSNSANVSRRANLVRAIEAAADEALDQEATIVYPIVGDGPERVVRAHETLSKDHDVSAICTVPMSEGSRLIGALLLERAEDRPFDAKTVQLAEHAAALLGPTLDTKRREDRWLPAKAWEAFGNLIRMTFGPRHAALKLGVLLTAAFIAFCWFATGTYRVTADSVVRGQQQRAVTVPVAGFLADSFVRAGDTVRSGELMAALDMTDLRLERLRWQSERAKQEREYSEAVARKERSRARILATQIDQADAQLQLIDEQISRMRLTAPFDGVVVTGDLSQALGAPVERGDVVFEIAPLTGYRVTIRADERDVGDLEPGQLGSLALAAVPSRPMPIEVVRITPISAAGEGTNTFEVEASILYQRGLELRPGMEGVAKIDIEERRLIWIWTRRIVLWAQMAWWSWTP